MKFQTVFDLLAEFDGTNHAQLAKKYGFTRSDIHRLINASVEAALVWAESPSPEPSPQPISRFERANTQPKEDATRLAIRRVNADLTVSINGIKYDVSHLKDVDIGHTVTVNPASLPHVGLDVFGFPYHASAIGSLVKEGTRHNGKPLVSPSEAEKFLQSSAFGKASSSPQETQAAEGLQSVGQPLPDHNHQPHPSTTLPAEQPPCCCLVSKLLLDQIAPCKHHSPNYLRDLSQLLALHFHHGSTS